MLKILHIISGLKTGGAERTLVRIISQTHCKSLEHIVIPLGKLGKPYNDLKQLNVTVIPADINKKAIFPVKMLRLINTVKKLDFDIIQGWMYHGNLVALILGCFLKGKVPILWNIRHTFYHWQNYGIISKLVIKLGALLSRHPVKIIFNSYKSELQHKSIGYNSKSIQIIPNGFECQLYRPSEALGEKVRKELKVDKEAFLIGLIARYHPMKDHLNFLKAAAELRRDYPSAQFVLAGEGVDNKNRKLWKNIHELKISERVHILGERSDIQAIYACLDIATNCSAWGESFSNSLCEAMACEVLCVGTDVGDSAKILNGCGLVVERNDYKALANAWKKLFEMDAEKKSRLRKKARKKVLKEFSLPVITNQYEKLYQKTIEDRKLASY